MLSGTGFQAAQGGSLSATYRNVPRDQATVARSELTRVQPMVFKHGLLVKTKDLENELPAVTDPKVTH